MFSKQKDSDQQVTAQVDGKQSTFLQSGLAAGQEYTVTVQGEVGGKRGGESSAEFQTREFRRQFDPSLFSCLVYVARDLHIEHV